MIASLLLSALVGLQDADVLAKKLGSSDYAEAENAKDDLLRLGEAAAGPVRKLLEGGPSGDLKRRAEEILERLEVRRAAPGIADRWGERWYSVLVNQVHLGWARMKAEAKDGKALFTDELYAKLTPDVELKVKATFRCRPDEYLSLEALTLEVETPERTVKATGKVKEGRLVLEADGELKAFPVKARLVPDLVLMRLVTLLPKTGGYVVDLFETVNPALKEDLALRFAAEEVLESGGRKLNTRRFDASDADGNLRSWWVDGEGRMLRSTFRGGEIEALLTTEEKARDLDKGF